MLKKIRKEGVVSMCDVAERLESKGRIEGEEKLSRLILLLTKDGRLEDITKTASDKEIRERLYKEFNIED